jgi:transcriptional regulator with XRE-family HTH domain
MEIDAKCSAVQAVKGWSQRKLAQEIGISEPNLISARKGRRPLPAHALAKLERLRGVDDKSIVDEIIRTAACCLMTIGILFFSAPQEAAANQDVRQGVVSGNTNYRTFRMIARAIRRLILRQRRHATALHSFAGWGLPAAA